MKAIDFLLLIICISVISCRQEIAPAAILNAEDGNFTYSADGSARLLIMDIPIGSGKSSLIFDTGGLGLLLDSLTAAQCLNMKKLDREGKSTQSSVYFPAASRDFFGTTYFHPIDIPFYGGTLHYDWFMVFDGLKDEFEYDGIFSIPQDDTRIWNFDFENLSISVSDSLSVSHRDSCDFVCNIERRGEKIYLTDFPICFSGKERLSMKQELLLDTGCSSALAFNFNKGELEEERQFMEDNALLYYKTYVGDHTFVIYSPEVINDTLMVTFRQKDQRAADFPHFVGLELLSKFDIAIDLENSKAYFRRNDTGNWAEYLNENSSFERKALSLIPDDDFKTAFVKALGKESPAYTGGLRQYDVIEKFDGGNFSSFNTKYAKMRQRGKGDTLTFNVDRFGEKKQIRFFWTISEQ